MERAILKIAHARILARTEARRRQLAAGVVSLSQKQAVAMSGEIYRAMIAENEDDPGSARLREAGLIADHLHLRPEKVKVVQLTKDNALFEKVLETYRTRRNGVVRTRFSPRGALPEMKDGRRRNDAE
ncbi:hypothetical protein GFL88_24775 [Rhizobium leguminosarum bv. viciae]|uniref:hypothetical protein n=1 Tax=Rhizobium leguminosarum TaxID=384 RepID=UPI0014417567|nr:hypothetical protein [Rhizobium leguminosarum]NKK66686.1 hypothetical protein [Rhizobium leguminosarum bv. viciae]